MDRECLLKRKDGKIKRFRTHRVRAILLGWFAPFLAPFLAALAAENSSYALFEFRAGFSYGRTNYNANDYTWNRMWSLALSYYLTRISRLEISYANQYTRSVFPAIQNTQITDQYITLNWVQGILPAKFPIQPYLKGGAGQLNRDATVSASNGLSSTIRMDSLTFVLGAGLRIPVSQSLGVESEIRGYIVNYDLNTWKDNLVVEGGIAVYF